MRLLLDTHTFLWWTDDDPLLPTAARKAIGDPRNNCYISIASCWEMAIKSSIGKLRLAMPVERFVTEQIADNGFQLLGIDYKHVMKVENIPLHHRDPFDRLLIAQALSEKMHIITADKAFSAYSVKCIWE